MQKLAASFKVITILTIVLLIAAGLGMTFFEVKPFWLDEWFIIYNIKYKSVDELWGTLDFMQQFPRLYLQIIRWFNSIFDYSYFSLHLTSFAVHAIALVFCYRLSALLYKEDILQRFLWVIIYASFRTGLEYFVQVKQYTMEMLLGLLAIWQMIILLKAGKEKLPPTLYLLLCSSFLLAPFFSYTYPIVAAPVFAVIFIHNVQAGKEIRNRMYQWLPLTLCIVAITAMYAVDTRQVMQDKGMQNYWGEYMMQDGFNIGLFAANIYKLFANAGSGGLFEVICGILGIFSWLYVTVTAGRYIKNERNYPALYSAILLWIIVVLFAIGKLPVGTHRLNAFAAPALGILIVHSLAKLAEVGKLQKATIAITAILFLAMAGNVYSTLINDFTGDEYRKKLHIYQNVSNGIALAEKQQAPVIVSTAIAYPYGGQVKADWIVKIYPAYKRQGNTPVYSIENAAGAMQFFTDSLQAPAAVVIDADSIWTISRQL